jgi:ABC-type transport system substrate-binding protein
MRGRLRTSFSVVALLVGAALLAASALGSVSQVPPNTFRFGSNGGIELDPAFISSQDESWAFGYAMGATLFSYPDAPAPRGSRLIPEVAAGFPLVSKDGRTYTIRLKRTYRFNNGTPVRAKHFEYALLRALGSATEHLVDIVGVRDMRGRATRIPGVRVLDAHILRIQIRERRPDLLARLAMPHFAAVPLNLPPRGRAQKPFLSAGPYFLREWSPWRRAILERNPFYRGPRPRRAHRIELEVDLNPEEIKRGIDNNALDAGDLLPAGAHAELARRYGVRSGSPGRYFVNPTPTVLYIAFNHDRPLFRGPTPMGNLPLKKAINYAIDRATIVRQRGAFAASTHDQLLPPTTPGFRDALLFPRRPDLARARQLAAGNTRDGKALIHCGNSEIARQVCRVVEANLREIGLEISRVGCPAGCWELPDYDLTLGGWHADFSDPSDFMTLVDGAKVNPRPGRGPNDSRFSDPRYTRWIRQAGQLVGERRHEAFGELDVDVMRNAAPLAVYGVANDRHYVSARVGCYHHHPVYGWDFPALCLGR